MSKTFMVWSSVVVGILIALTEAMAWPGSLNYLWAIIVIIWGFMCKGKR